mgnify:CR=1 FL=1
MKILVTGNMGYVGPGVVRQLRAAYPDAKIYGLDEGFFAHCLTNGRLLPETRVDAQYFADVRTASPELFEGVNAVVHLAAISNDAMGKAHDSVTYDINYKASVRAAELAKKAGASHFVFASSCSTYGFADDTARTETSPVNPLTAYAKSKVMTEEGLAPLAGDSFTVTCLRFATACGMSERLRLDLVLNDFVAAAITSGNIEILSDGKPWRPLIHVRDMARAIEWAVARKPENGGDFLVINAGSDEWNYQVRDLAHAVAGHFKGVTVSINENASPDKRSYKVDFALYRKLAPKHQPKITLDDAIMDLKQGLESIGFSDSLFRQSKLIRLNVLSKLREAQHVNESLQLNKQF